MKDSIRSASVGGEGFDRLVDRLGQTVPEGLPELAGFTSGQPPALRGLLGEDRDDGMEVGLEQASQVLELGGQLQPS